MVIGFSQLDVFIFNGRDSNVEQV